MESKHAAMNGAPPGSPGYAELGPLHARIAADLSRLSEIDDRLREVRRREAELDRWLGADKRHAQALTRAQGHLKDGEGHAARLEVIDQKLGELRAMKYTVEAASQNAQQRLIDRATSALFAKIGMTPRVAPAVPEGEPAPAEAHTLEAIDRAIALFEAEREQVLIELAECNRLADEANREAITQRAYAAALAHDEALHVYAESFAAYRAVHREAFGIDPETPDPQRLADAIDAAKAPPDDDDEQPAQPKRGLLGLFR
jgi:hypothetical protein